MHCQIILAVINHLKMLSFRVLFLPPPLPLMKPPLSVMLLLHFSKLYNCIQFVDLKKSKIQGILTLSTVQFMICLTCLTLHNHLFECDMCNSIELYSCRAEEVCSALMGIMKHDTFSSGVQVTNSTDLLKVTSPTVL